MQRRPIDANHSSFAHQNAGGGGGRGADAYYASPPSQHQHHQHQQPYLSPQHNYNLLDDDDGKKKKRFGGGGRMLRHFFNNNNNAKGGLNPFAVIFFLLFAFSYFRWTRVAKKFEQFKANADGSMKRFKELSGSRERRCLETLEDREREMGELRANIHEKEKEVESATHKFNACELKLSGHHEEKKLSVSEKAELKEQLETLRHEKENLMIEMSKWKDEAGSAKDELVALKKHHELEKHDASVKHEADLDVMDEGYNAVIDNDGVLHEHTDEEYEELKRAFEALSKKHNLEHKEFYYESAEPHDGHTEKHADEENAAHQHQHHHHDSHEPHPGDGHNVHHVEHVESTEIPNHRKSSSHSNSHEGQEEEEDNRPLWERYTQ